MPHKGQKNQSPKISQSAIRNPPSTGGPTPTARQLSPFPIPIECAKTSIMLYLDLTLDTAAENLALDEALLDMAESGEGPDEVLRIWEPTEPMIVAGRSTRLHQEIKLDACRRDRIPVLRRSSGGATIITGPGCLMYAVVLSYQQRPRLRAIDQAHSYVLGLLTAALASEAPTIAHQGTSDLVLLGPEKKPVPESDEATTVRKFSGNSLRCKRTHLLYHGTLLYDFPLELISRYLDMPSRQPDYRQNRDHGNFVTNLPLQASTLREKVLEAFNATEQTRIWPQDLVANLVQERYTQESWTKQFK